jgi:patatin-like phospholipase/acyl hydrolase
MENFAISFDGGGIRALASIQVLKKISYLLEKKGIDELPVDLLSGTSAGSIIALVLSRKEFSFKENIAAIESAFDNFESIFVKATDRSNPIYLNSGLKKLGDTLFGDRKLKDAKIPVAVFAYDILSANPIILSSLRYPQISMSEAMQSSCCAPGFFSPIKISKDNLELVDGGVFANNPVIYTYLEAKQLFPEATMTNILSISTMWQPTLYNDNKIINEAKLLSNAQMRTSDIIAESITDLNYYRIHKFNLEEQIKMDKTDFETKQKLIELGELLAYENLEKINSFIDNLIMRQSI